MLENVLSWVWDLSDSWFRYQPCVTDQLGSDDLSVSQDFFQTCSVAQGRLRLGRGGDIARCKVTVQNSSNDRFSPNFHALCIFHGKTAIVYSETSLYSRVCVCNAHTWYERETNRVGSGGLWRRRKCGEGRKKDFTLKQWVSVKGETWCSCSTYSALFQALFFGVQNIVFNQAFMVHIALKELIV